MSTRLRLILAGVAVLVALAVVGPYAFIHFIEGDPPQKLTVSDAVSSGAGPTTTVAVPDSFDGTWTAAVGSQAGYRVKETLFGQSTTATGRTTAVTGTMQVGGSTVSTAAITVDLTKVSSDQSQRDGQFQNRIMQTAKFPNATFALAAPVALATVPGDGVATSAIASGQLTLHGVTKTVAVTLAIRRTGGSIAVGGSIPITFADYAIDNPSGGPATTGDAGELEFVVAFVKA